MRVTIYPNLNLHSIIVNGPEHLPTYQMVTDFFFHCTRSLRYLVQAFEGWLSVYAHLQVI